MEQRNPFAGWSYIVPATPTAVRRFLIGLVAFPIGLAWFPANGEEAPKPRVSIPGANVPGRAYFAREPVSREARKIADWIVDSSDNHGLPFAIVDKVSAKVFVFDAGGRIRGAAPALLGLARGDDSAPGIGQREMSRILPAERTTPAGRFVAQLGVNFYGTDILWVDYDAAISLHRVITTRPKDRRLERLASATPLDNRISFGCINVPAKFFDQIVRPAFAGTHGIVYVLPETRPANVVFASYDVDKAAARKPRLPAGTATDVSVQRP